MARLIASLPALALGIAAVLALASCGEEDAQLLEGETAREITANLDTVGQLAAEGDCAGAESAARQVGEQVEALEGVDARLQRALREGAARLSEVVAECEESTSEAIAPAVIPEEAEDGEEDGKDGRGGGKGNRPERGGKERDGNEDGGRGGAAEGEGSLPPQAKGEGKGLEPEGDDEDAPEPPAEDEGGGEAPGGLSPGSPAGEGE